MTVQLNMRGASGGPIALFYGSVEDALKDAWEYTQAHLAATPLSIVENGVQVYDANQLREVGNLHAKIKGWSAQTWKS